MLQASRLSERARSDADQNVLISKAITGCPRAFMSLWSSHRISAEKGISSFKFNAFDHDDVLQDTFEKAFRGMPYFRSDSSFSTWIFSIARNTAIKVVSKISYRVEFSADMARVCSLNSDLFEDPAAYQVRAAGLEQLRAGVAKLPQMMRETFAHRYLADRDYAAIAHIMDCPEGTVRSRLARARQILQNSDV